jgi:hypothetical protein
MKLLINNRYWRSREARRGMALVVTLVMLSIITFMAVTFLVVSSAERKSVATTTDQTIARLAAEGGMDRAVSEIEAGVLATGNPFNYDLRVSTNWFSTNFFGKGVAHPTNVVWPFPTAVLDYTLNIANLMYNPRVPVYVPNPSPTNLDFRYYLDLNRNGRFEETVSQIYTNTGGLCYNLTKKKWEAYTSGQSYWTISVVGDPQWIGVLERAGQPHSASNYFVSRYAYVVLPAGKTLDLNHIHNDAGAFSVNKTNMANGYDAFRRDQGTASFELNLAAFLADLNTNQWFTNASAQQYFYYNGADISLKNKGFAFDDAGSLLSYRYGNNVGSLAQTYRHLRNSFMSNYVDDLLSGPLMTNLWWRYNGDYDYDRFSLTANNGFPWAGADNYREFYNLQQLFDTNVTAQNPGSGINNFTGRLQDAGSGTNAYDRYTFYRLLAQLGTDSAAEKPDKIHLTYDNQVRGVTNPVTKQVSVSATNLIKWDPTDFFVTAANRLFATNGYNFKLTNLHGSVADINGMVFTTNLDQAIQVWPTNQYTPSVHRALQLAANIYDASTSRTFPGVVGTNGQLLDYPSVFRPVFSTYKRGATNTVVIVGYSEVTNANDMYSYNWLELTNVASLKPMDMFYGLPMVIGAKKGWPNFNKFAQQTDLQITRKLQFVRPGTGRPKGLTNQVFVLSISNSAGVEYWNSYKATMTRNLTIYNVMNTSAVVSNDVGKPLLNIPGGWFTINCTPRTNFSTANPWPGVQVADEQLGKNSYAFPLLTNFLIQPKAQYTESSPGSPATGQLQNLPENTGAGTLTWMASDTGQGLTCPRWWFRVRTRLMSYVMDSVAGLPVPRIVDFVNLDSQQDPSLKLPVPVFYALSGSPATNATPDDPRNIGEGTIVSRESMWYTNQYEPTLHGTYGIEYQIRVCMGKVDVTTSDWKNFGGAQNDYTRVTDINNFKQNLGLLVSASNGSGETNDFYTPYDPVGHLYFNIDWQANDPLVHYTVGDLIDSFDPPKTNNPIVNDTVAAGQLMQGVDRNTPLSKRYSPWNKRGTSDNEPQINGSEVSVFKNMALKDPMVQSSDDWNFPTNAFPSVGWLGRVHRGTPWQTVYFKAGAVDSKIWSSWAGGGVSTTNVGQIATSVLPVWDGVSSNGIILDNQLTYPTNDYRLVDIFTTAMNDNMTRGRLSVNQTNLAAWSAVLAGVSVLSNSANYKGAPISNLFIEPAGVFQWPTTNYAALPPIWKIVNGTTNLFSGINGRRAIMTNAFVTTGAYGSVGDILTVPELTTNSPFLNLNSPNSLTDEYYERIPQQILGLLQCESTPRFVIYAYGQALKPAEHSLVMNASSGPLGLCTNYQIMSEAAIRAVLRIDNATTEPHAVIESFNALGPD